MSNIQERDGNIQKHNPGSEEAQEKGCTCPVIDNHFGRGRPVRGQKDNEFIFSMECPYHCHNK